MLLTCFENSRDLLDLKLQENRDPLKISPLLELLMDNPLNGDGGSFGDSRSVYTFEHRKYFNLFLQFRFCIERILFECFCSFCCNTKDRSLRKWTDDIIEDLCTLRWRAL